jgi:hypothetical protein
MNRADKIALFYILTSFGIGVGFTLYSTVLLRRDKAAGQLETNAKNYANAEVLRLFLDDKIRTKEDMDREFKFAYMNYRAHH